MSHEKVETNIGLMMVLIILVISVGGLIEIVPLFCQRDQSLRVGHSGNQTQ